MLEIGTGSGYQTAVLLGLTPHVYTVERQQELFKKTQRLFSSTQFATQKKMSLGMATKACLILLLMTG